MWLMFSLSVVMTASSPFPEDLPRGVGVWDAASLGNHHVLVKVDAPAIAVRQSELDLAGRQVDA